MARSDFDSLKDPKTDTQYHYTYTHEHMNKSVYLLLI
jgi:hypothetical protein